MSQKTHDYLQDVKTIKGILEQREDRVLLPPWSFYAWSIVILAATVTSKVAMNVGWSSQQIVLWIWGGAILLGGLLEALGWFQYIRNMDQAIFTTVHIKLLSCFTGVVAAVCGIAISLISRGVEISGELLLLISICFFVLGIFTFKAIFIESYNLLFAGLILILLRALDIADSESLYIFSGVFVSINFFVAGNRTRKVQKRSHI